MTTSESADPHHELRDYVDLGKKNTRKVRCKQCGTRIIGATQQDWDEHREVKE